MKLKVVVMVVGAMAVMPALADQAGVLRSVEGSVTVTSSTGVTKAVSGTVLAPNSRILVGSGSKATVILSDGCVIPLVSNQFLALNPRLVCSQLVASVGQLAAPYRVAQAGGAGAGVVAGTGAGTAGSLLVVGMTAASFVTLDQVTSNDLSGQ